MYAKSLFSVIVLLLVVNLGSSLQVLDASNTKVLDSLICKHLKDSAMQKISQSISQQNSLEHQCIVKVNQTIKDCISCSKSACTTPPSVPVVSNHGSSIQDTVKGILEGLAQTPVNVVGSLTKPIIDGVSHVAHEVSHGIEHVGHEISHGIHHIGHQLHHVFGKRLETCALKCAACQKVNSNDTNVVKNTVCGNDYVAKTNELKALVPKFRDLSKAIQNQGILKKVEYDPASLVQNGGSLSYSTVYLTVNVRGSLHRFQPSAKYELMNGDSTATHWSANVLNMFLS